MLDTEVARLLAKRDTEGFTGTVEKSIEKLAPKPRVEGLLPVPVSGDVSSNFGLRDDLVHKKKSFHAGKDIAAPGGSEIRAVSSGTVTFSGMAARYGKMVEIDHGAGMLTRYAHNAANLVSVGQEVRAGQTIGLVGSTGRATGAHLHLEVRQYGNAVDPRLLIHGQARLPR
jgi:murein DD-endopeptidase MepM/ murein hydrolase activator NlpD